MLFSFDVPVTGTGMIARKMDYFFPLGALQS